MVSTDDRTLAALTLAVLAGSAFAYYKGLLPWWGALVGMLMLVIVVSVVEVGFDPQKRAQKRDELAVGAMVVGTAVGGTASTALPSRQTYT